MADNIKTKRLVGKALREMLSLEADDKRFLGDEQRADWYLSQVRAGGGATEGDRLAARMLAMAQGGDRQSMKMVLDLVDVPEEQSDIEKQLSDMF